MKTAPSFDNVLSGLEPGIYSASRLNPPGGHDCTHLLVHSDGSLSWCDANGNDTTDCADQRFSAAELCAD